MCGNVANCGCSAASYGVGMQVNPGNVPNPHIQRGETDMTPYPVTYRRHLNWPGAQLRNGVGDLAFPTRLKVPAAGYMFGQIPRSPGLNRVTGRNTADFIPRGGSPSQWDYHTAQGPGMQPTSPGGPGQIVVSNGNPVSNPGSGA